MKSSTENPHEWHEHSEERNTYIALDTTQHGVVVTEFDLALPNLLHDLHIRIKNIAPFRRRQICPHVSTGAAWSGCRLGQLCIYVRSRRGMQTTICRGWWCSGTQRHSRLISTVSSKTVTRKGGGGTTTHREWDNTVKCRNVRFDRLTIQTQSDLQTHSEGFGNYLNHNLSLRLPTPCILITLKSSIYFVLNFNLNIITVCIYWWPGTLLSLKACTGLGTGSKVLTSMRVAEGCYP